MARYYEAPVVKAVDYAFQYPIEPIYEMIQQQQKLQDEGLATATKLYDVNKQNVLNQQYDRETRDRLINEYNAEVDNIIYDEQGNVRDLRNVMSQVQSIARRRAAEEQTGGTRHALQTNLDTRTEWAKEVGKLLEEKKITADHATWALRKADAEYDAQGGIGQKNEAGFYQQYNTFNLAHTVNPNERASKIADDWRTDMFQQGMLHSVTGKFQPNQANIDQIRKDHPNYVDINGTLLQTGTLEIAALEEIYDNTVAGLMNESDTLQYLEQEAQFQGGATTQEEINAYVQNAIHQSALVAAERNAKMHFNPEAYQNWRAKADYEHRLRVKEIEHQYTLEHPLNVVELNSQNQIIKPDPDKLLNDFTTTSEMLALKEKALKDLLASAKGDPSAFNPESKLMYQNLQDEIALLNAQMYSYTALVDKADESAKKNGVDLYSDASRTIYRSMLGYSPESGGTPLSYNSATEQKVKEWLKSQYSTSSELLRAMQNGTLQGPELAKFVRGIQGELNNSINSELNELGISPDVWNNSNKGQTAKSAANGVVDFRGVTEGYTRQIKKEINKLNDSGGMEMQTKYGFYTSKDDNIVKSDTDGLLFLLKNGKNDTFRVLNDSTPLVSVQDYWGKLGLGGEVDMNSVTLDYSDEVNEQTGTPVFRVNFNVKKGNTTMPQSVVVYTDRKAPGNIPETRSRQGVAMIDAHMADPSKPSSYDQAARGSLLLGTTDYGQSFSDARIHDIKPGESTVVFNGTSPELEVFRLKDGSGYIVSQARQTGGGSMKWGDVNTVLSGVEDGNNFGVIKDVRPWGNQGAYLFRDVNSIYETLGYIRYPAHKNKTADLYKKRTGSYAGYPETPRN